MPSVIQRSLAGGELDPALHARADQVKYQTGLRTCRNMQVRKSGGVRNRAGFAFVGRGKVLGQPVRLVKFVFNDEQTYVLEFGVGYMRVIRNGAYVLANAPLGAWSAVTTYAIGDVVTHLGNTYVANFTNMNETPSPGGTFYWTQITDGIYERLNGLTVDQILGLKYAQDHNIITFTIPGHGAALDLVRVDHAAWYFSADWGQLGITAPGSIVFTSGGAGSNEYRYVVTAVSSDGKESGQSIEQGGTGLAAPTEAAPHVLDWTAAPSADAAAYNVYRGPATGAYGFIGSTTGTVFRDIGLPADYANSLGLGRHELNSGLPNSNPSALTYVGSRIAFANTPVEPQAVWLSAIALRTDFRYHIPPRDSDSIKFTIRGKRANPVHHLLEVDGRFIAFTGGGEILVQGNAAGVLTPAEPNPKQSGYNGASDTVAPVVVDATALYVIGRGNGVRDLSFSATVDSGVGTTYRGRDLSIYADHLFRGYTITALDFALRPDSIAYAVRSDGTLLGLTYLPEHDLWGWHRHDTDGQFEDVCVVPEGGEDVVYVSVVREIGGVEYRHIERQKSRHITNIAIDAYFVDSGLTYDGRNTTAETMTLSGGSAWDVTEVLTLTRSSGGFTADEIGNEIVLRAGTDVLRLAIVGYTSSTVVTVAPSKNVPAAFRDAALTDWGRAVDELAGLGHLEGKSVVALADGNVERDLVVASGSVTLTRPYEVIHVGLAYIADLETLDLEVVNGQTLADKKRRVNQVTLFTEDSRPFSYGDDADHLKELPMPNALYADPSAVLPTKVEVVPSATWNTHGRVFIRQADPLPLAINAIVPSGFTGG